MDGWGKERRSALVIAKGDGVLGKIGVLGKAGPFQPPIRECFALRQRLGRNTRKIR